MSPAPGSVGDYFRGGVTGSFSSPRPSTAPLLPLEPLPCVAAVVGSDRLLSRFFQGRAGVEGGGAAQVTRLGFVVRAAAMHRAAIVPDHQIADPPLVAVDKLRPGRVQIEVVEQDA